MRRGGVPILTPMVLSTIVLMRSQSSLFEFISTFEFERRDRIYLLLVYSKGVKDDLSRAEENELRRLGRALEGEK